MAKTPEEENDEATICEALSLLVHPLFNALMATQHETSNQDRARKIVEILIQARIKKKQ